ncbi:hypothetical protein ACWEQ8_43430, partial [Streptomyces noursei]
MLQLSARLDGDSLPVSFRINAMRTETLNEVARAQADGPTSVTSSLDRLAAVVQRTIDPNDDTGWHPAAIDAAA